MSGRVPAYLDRIGYRGAAEPTTGTLAALQVAHLRAVPFENLSIHLPEPIVLDDAALYEKVVRRRRGGFCYELNGLFAWLLRALGFDVRMLAGEVAKAQGGFGQPFDHMALLVTLDGRPWLADVGFGDSFLEPLPLAIGEEQVQGADAFRIERLGERLLLARRDPAAGWLPQYRFDLTPHAYADYEAMCRYHQTSPDSPFTRRRVCSRATADGRITLSDRRLIVTAGGERREEELPDEAAYVAALRTHFDVVLTRS